MKQYLTFSDGTSNKFWAVQVVGRQVGVTYGKIGTAGQSSAKTYENEAAAARQAEKQAAAKIKKGYVLADAPQGFTWPGGAAPAPQKAAAKPAAKTAANEPAPKKDTGKAQPWHEGGYFDGWGYSDERFENLKNPPEEPKAPPAKAPEKQAQPPAPQTPKAPDKDEGYYYWTKGIYTRKDSGEEGEQPLPARDPVREDQLEEALEDRFTFGRYCQKGSLALVERCLALMEKSWEEADRQKHMDTGMYYILSCVHVPYDAIPVLQLLLEHGGSFVQLEGADIWFVNRYLGENKTPADVPAMFTEYYDAFFVRAMPRYAEAVRGVLQYFQGGEKASWIYPRAPETWPEGCTAIEIQVDGDKCKVNSVKPIDGWRYWGHMPLDDEEGIGEKTARPYLVKMMPAHLEQMAKEGLFDGFVEKEISVFVKGEEQPIFIYRAGEEELAQQRAKLEEMIEGLETATEDAHEAVQDVDEQLAAAVEALLKEGQLPRAVVLVRKYLYSTSQEWSEAAERQLKEHEQQHIQLQYEHALWQHANFNYIYAKADMEELAEQGYAPAKAKLEEFLALAHERALRKPKQETEPEQNTESKAPKQRLRGYKGPSEIRRIFAARFTETDLFIETDNIIARADPDGKIYLRFKVEGEAGYSEALDFLNNLLEKEYAGLFGGYALYVRFIQKPVFIKELVKDFPHTSCHAFFARAVQYPALRERVAQYAQLALVPDTWYEDLNGDADNTLPGTFAACALAFADERYIHLAGEYALASDNEHQHIQLEVAPALLKKYGPTPEVAKAVFDICTSDGQAHGVSTKKELYTNYENLAAVMQYCSEQEFGEQQLEWYVPAYMDALLGDDARANLRKLKSLANKSKTQAERETYVDFYNFYKEYAEKRDDEDYGENLGSTAKEHADLKLPVYNEPLPPVVKLAAEPALEAQVRPGDEYWGGEKRCLLLAPAALTTREEDEYVRGQLEMVHQSERLSYYRRVQWCRGRMCLRMGKWLIDTRRLARPYAVALYDGKNKPWLLYGLFNMEPLVARYYASSYKQEWQAETARREFLLAESPEAAEISEQMDERFKAIQRAIEYDKWYLVDRLTAAFTPEDGPFYTAALLARRQLALYTEDDAELARIEGQLVSIQ